MAIRIDRSGWIKAIMFDRFGFQIRTADIARILGVSASTAARKKKDPTQLTLGEAIDIAKATGLPDDAWLQILRG